MSTRLREAVVTLSSGSVWVWVIPADPGDEWPVDAPVYTRFKSTTGAVVASVDAVEVTPTEIRFLAQPDEVDDVARGASFETFVETDDGPMKIRYGIVIRRQAGAFDAQTLAQQVSRQFTDTFQRTALGNRWEAVTGSKNTVKIWDNTAYSLPYGLAANTDLFQNRGAAVRYYQPLAGDSVRSTFTIVVPPPFLVAPNDGKATHVVCADQNFTTGLGLQLDTTTNLIHMARITSPSSMVFVGSQAANTPLSNDNYTVTFNDLTDTFSIFKGVSATPVTTPWVDSGGIVPHGPGYRYAGFIMQPASEFETGPQISGWAAKDEV